MFWKRSDLDSGKKIRVLKLGGGVFWKVKTQSAKICLNFNGGGGGVLESLNPKCQDLHKFQFGGGGGSGMSKPKVSRSA